LRVKADGSQVFEPIVDQINLRLPRSLAGRGDVEVRLTVNGRAANVAGINVK
jgi:uncharacterized protein (TIGR03437 family)